MKSQKRAVYLLAATFALLLSVVLVACGGGSGSSQAAAPQRSDAFVGLWEVSTYTIDGELTDEATVKSYRDAGYYTIYLELGKDGSLTLDNWGSTVFKGTWQSSDDSNATFTITEKDGVSEGMGSWSDPMTIKDNVMTFGSDDFIMTMVRMENDNRSSLKKVDLSATE